MCLKATNIVENDEKSSKKITCCNDQKSTVARKGKSPALQRGLMNNEYWLQPCLSLKNTRMFNPLHYRLNYPGNGAR
ncbi:hypothetical protein SY86_14015 [Erwinia tracheiphila]|uniref:Uncharacterized protein n=1 Tax=Erwinia tracheiphila TaxID=65700 RepID=A0A0M2KA77_9GAMM|nr:hypothetical protein SY86_14015 [Erwinia tracheiphila]